MDKVTSLKNMFNRLFGATTSGDTICEVLDNATIPTAPTPKEIVLASSTESSTKKFKITVVDNGTIAATEITD